MKIYLAARFSLRPQLLEYIPQLEALGHTCCSRWITKEPDAYAMPESEREAILRLWSTRDMDDVEDADLFIFFAEGPDVPGRARGGRHVEYGIAMANGIEIWVVGPKENIFHWLKDVTHFPSWDELLVQLKQYSLV